MKNGSYYTREEVVKLIRQRMGTNTQEEFAAQVGISYQLLSNILIGSRSPGQKILKFLKLVKEVSYRKA